MKPSALPNKSSSNMKFYIFSFFAGQFCLPKSRSFPDRGSASKNLSILTPKNGFIDPDPGSAFWFFTYPVSRGQKATGSRIPDLDLHHCFPVLEDNFSLPGSVSRYAEPLNLDLYRIWIRNTDPIYAYLLNPGSLPDAGSLITFILAKSARCICLLYLPWRTSIFLKTTVGP